MSRIWYLLMCAVLLLALACGSSSNSAAVNDDVAATADQATPQDSADQLQPDSIDVDQLLADLADSRVDLATTDSSEDALPSEDSDITSQEDLTPDSGATDAADLQNFGDADLQNSDAQSDTQQPDGAADQAGDDTASGDLTPVEDLTDSQQPFDVQDANDPPSDAGSADIPDLADSSDLELDVAQHNDGDESDVGNNSLPAVWLEYFAAHPTVRDATISRLDATAMNYFRTYLLQLENDGTLVVEEPQASKDCVEPTSCSFIFPTTDELAKILAAKYAHAVWLDKNDTVSWKLKDFSQEHLDELFDPTLLMQNGTFFKYVVDFSPSDAYQYMLDQGLLKQDMLSTLVAVVDDLRTTDSDVDFIHGIASRDPTNTAVTIYDALRTFIEPRISRKGCHSMTRIILGMLRSVNIPGREVNGGQWYLNLHSTAVWTIVERVLTHGDNIYSAALRAAPSSEILTPFAFFQASENTDVCGASQSCLALRYNALIAVTYPPSYYVTRCCDPVKWNVGSCLEYLTSTYGAYLTPGEITAGVAAMEALCTD